MAAPRTKKSQKIYDEYVASGGLEGKCPLCEAPPIQEFENWKVIINRFPYDKIAQKHHMLVPKRHVPEAKLSESEKAELASVKTGHIAENYEYILEATVGMKSIPAHFHLHLMNFI